MRYNRQSDYYISPEIAQAWWKAMPTEKFSVIDANAAESGKRSDGSDGVWVVVNSRNVDLAGVLTQILPDGSGRWGLSVLWYDRERCSRLARFLRAGKLSQSKEAADCIGEIVRSRGGTPSRNTELQ